MRKILISSMLFAGVLFLGSCEKEEVGGTATQSMAGQWYVTADACFNDISETVEDIYGAGRFMLFTYNDASNSKDVLFIDDQENFWEFKGKASCNLSDLTFSGEDIENEYYDMNFTVKNGKILKGAATTPSGAKADSICFDLYLGDDDNIGEYYDFLRITGFRYTGLAADE